MQPHASARTKEGNSARATSYRLHTQGAARPLQNARPKDRRFPARHGQKSESQSGLWAGGLSGFHARSHWFRMPSPPARLSSAPGSPAVRQALLAPRGRACSQFSHCPTHAAQWSAVQDDSGADAGADRNNTKSFAPCPMPRAAFAECGKIHIVFNRCWIRQARTQALPARECRASPLDMT